MGRCWSILSGDVGQWSGTSTDLIHELEAKADEKTKRLKSWPATPRTLGAAVKRLAPNLREAGIGVEFNRTGRSRTITLTRKEAESCVISVTNDTATNKRGIGGDNSVTQNERGDAGDDFSVTSETPVNPGVNGKCDTSDVSDAKIPVHSPDSEWSEL